MRRWMRKPDSAGHAAAAPRRAGAPVARTARQLATTALALLAIVGALAPRAAADESDARERARRAARSRYLKREWGVEILWVRALAAGHMLQMRYRVTDPEKAEELFVRANKPVLVHERSGLKLRVPSPATTGEMRNSNAPKEGRIYWMLFGNPGGIVESGDTVTIQIGSFEVEGLVVE